MNLDKQFYAVIPTDPQFQEALQLWERYYSDCEAYDRSVCTGMKGNKVMPVGPGEFGAINVFARRCAATTREELQRRGVDSKTSRRAQAEALRNHDRNLI